MKIMFCHEKKKREREMLLSEKQMIRNEAVLYGEGKGLSQEQGHDLME